jgi:hypothetical protein
MKYTTSTLSIAGTAVALMLGVASLALAQTQPAQPAQVQSAEAVYGPVVGTIPVPAGLTTEGVRTIVANCFAGREWTVRESVGSRVVGYLMHRGTEVQMTVICDPQQIVMYSNGWKLDRSGRPIIPDQPERWINYLRSDISKRLAKSGLAR